MPKRSVARAASSPPLATQAIAEGLLSGQFLESIPDAIVAVQHDGTIVRVNSQTEALFGYPVANWWERKSRFSFRSAFGRSIRATAHPMLNPPRFGAWEPASI
jgi:PAS domain-containing protein